MSLLKKIFGLKQAAEDTEKPNFTGLQSRREEWLAKFRTAEKEANIKHVHNMLTEVYKETIHIVGQGKYISEKKQQRKRAKSCRCCKVFAESSELLTELSATGAEHTAMVPGITRTPMRKSG